MIEATCIDHLSSTSNSLADPIDLSDSSTTRASPSSSDFPELHSFSTSSSYHISADCSLLLSPVSSVGSPPMEHIVKQYALFPDNTMTGLPSPPNSGKMFYPDWNAHFDFDQGPGPNDDVAIPQEFYMQERCTPDPESFLGSYPLDDAQNQSVLNQPAPYFVAVPHLGSNGPPMMDMISVQSADSPQTLETASEVSTPREDSKVDTASPEEPSRERSASPDPEVKKKEEGDSEMKDGEDSADESYTSSRRSSSAGVKKPKKKRAAPRRSAASQKPPPVDIDDHKNCFGDEVPPQLKDTCPAEEKCIFSSRWEHRDQKGQDMWDSIQEDYYKAFSRYSGKETLQMKLARGRSRYIQWLEKDEDILLQAWQNMERNRYKTLLEEFHKLGGSRNMLLNSTDMEFKVVVDMALEEGIYVEGVNEMELRRRCRFLAGKRKAESKAAREPGISYSGPSLFERTVDEEEVMDQVVAQESRRKAATRKPLVQRRRKLAPKGPKKVKAETN